MYKKVLFLICALVISNMVIAQTTTENYKEVIAEKQAQIAEKQAAIAKLQGEVGALQGEIDALPGWVYGVGGTIGVNFSNYNSWFTQGNPNAASTAVGISMNGFANYDEPKYFWRNGGALNLGWLSVKKDADFSLSDLEQVSDVFNVSSLFGYKLTEKFAISALGEYRTTFLNNFNDPGYLDIGVGATWTPMPKMVVVLHPLNYNFVFSSTDNIYESSLGAKFLVDYNDTVAKYIKWRSNFSGFLSYKSTDLANWTWVNSFGFTAFKGVGVGFEFGLRGNKQESFDNFITTTGNPENIALEDLSSDDNPVQTYWLLGLSFAF